MRSVKDPKAQALLWLQLEASRAGYAHTQGEKVRWAIEGWTEWMRGWCGGYAGAWWGGQARPADKRNHRHAP